MVDNLQKVQPGMAVKLAGGPAPKPDTPAAENK